jgi:hypothetical protein
MRNAKRENKSTIMKLFHFLSFYVFFFAFYLTLLCSNAAASFKPKEAKKLLICDFEFLSLFLCELLPHLSYLHYSLKHRGSAQIFSFWQLRKQFNSLQKECGVDANLS